MSQNSEVTPDTFADALSATEELEALMLKMNAQAPPTVTPADRVALSVVPEPAVAPAEGELDAAPLTPAPVAAPAASARAARRAEPARRTRSAPEPAPSEGKAARYPANIPASLHEALARDCEVTGLSITARTLAALNAQEAHLAGVFPSPVTAVGPSGAIPVRATVRRRKNLPEPSVTVTLYLDGEQADAVRMMGLRLNAGSRSNLVTEALRRDLPD